SGYPGLASGPGLSAKTKLRAPYACPEKNRRVGLTCGLLGFPLLIAVIPPARQPRFSLACHPERSRGIVAGSTLAPLNGIITPPPAPSSLGLFHSFTFEPFHS